MHRQIVYSALGRGFATRRAGFLVVLTTTAATFHHHTSMVPVSLSSHALRNLPVCIATNGRVPVFLGGDRSGALSDPPSLYSEMHAPNSTNVCSCTTPNPHSNSHLRHWCDSRRIHPEPLPVQDSPAFFDSSNVKAQCPPRNALPPGIDRRPGRLDDESPARYPNGNCRGESLPPWSPITILSTAINLPAFVAACSPKSNFDTRPNAPPDTAPRRDLC